MIHVIAQVEVKEDQQDAFLQEFKKIVPAVLEEKGCLEYGPTVDAATDLERQHRDTHMVTIIERWETLDDLKAHLVAPHMNTYREKVKDLVISARLNVLRPA